MDYQATIRAELEKFVGENPMNSLAAHGGERIYDAPLVGFASADDPVFEILKDPTVIGPHHKMPSEWLPGARTVVSYFLPFTSFVRKSNYIEGMPSEEWVSARIDGEAFNNAVRKHLMGILERLGSKAMVPALTRDFAITNRRSNWSERHAAYTAGLGTFGLSHSLITERGTAGRYGSAITTLEITPTPREAKTIHDACPFLVSGECGVCIARCPSQAITEKGKDIAVCAAYLDDVVKPKFAPRYGCAKCQTNVPCEFERP